MKLDARFKDDGTLELEYDQEAEDMLIKAGVYSALYSAIDKEKIAKLEARVAHWRRKYYKLKGK